MAKSVQTKIDENITSMQALNARFASDLTAIGIPASSSESYAQLLNKLQTPYPCNPIHMAQQSAPLPLGVQPDMLAKAALENPVNHVEFA